MSVDIPSIVTPKYKPRKHIRSATGYTPDQEEEVLLSIPEALAGMYLRPMLQNLSLGLTRLCSNWA